MVQIHALPLQFLKYFYDTDKGGYGFFQKNFIVCSSYFFNFLTIKLFNPEETIWCKRKRIGVWSLKYPVWIWIPLFTCFLSLSKLLPLLSLRVFLFGFNLFCVLFFNTWKGKNTVHQIEDSKKPSSKQHKKKNAINVSSRKKNAIKVSSKKKNVINVSSLEDIFSILLRIL